MPDVVERGGECVTFVMAQQVEIASGDFDKLSGTGRRVAEPGITMSEVSSRHYFVEQKLSFRLISIPE